MLQKRIQGIVLVTIAAVLFGLMPLWVIKVYDSGGNSIFLSFCRFALSVPVLFALDRKFFPGHSHPPPDRKFFVVCVTYVLTPSLLFFSYTRIASGLATTAHFTYPALVLLLCRVMFHQKIPAAKYLCCLLCLGGVALFCTVGDQVDSMGLILALFSAVTYALYVSYLPVSGVQEILSPFCLTLRLNLAGVIVLAVLNTVMDTWAFHMTLEGWIYTLALSWGTAVGATILFQRGVQLCGPQNAAICSVLEPLTSVVCGVVFLSEPCTSQIVVGISLILSAVFILSLCEMPGRKKKTVP